MDSHAERSTFEVLDGLRRIGYRGPLLEEGYTFPDWFAQQTERRCVAAAFGQTPPSYESACIGVVRAGGTSRSALIDQFRGLAAPIILEIDDTEIREWAVSRERGAHALLASYSLANLQQAFSDRASEWKPETLLRAKNIGTFNWTRQMSLFSGLVPELETEIQEQLEPMLRETLSETRRAYKESSGREPSPEALFRVVFLLLTAKVFRDRKISGFTGLSDDPDVLLSSVAKQYRIDPPRLLNRDARDIAARLIWRSLDFRNLSVEVLSQIWSTALVDTKTRKRLGIHRTPRTIVRYILERIPFAGTADQDSRIVFEPCCGSAAFLVGAMNALRPTLFGLSAAERHQYFVRHLAGVEYDPFGVEISTLALTLADFPNPNGWHVTQKDVFLPGAMKDYLRRAAVVLCNPPFEDFDTEQRSSYELTTPSKPVALLDRVLDDLHPSGVLGFVLPASVVDGKKYTNIRRRLSDRFASLELTVLPDKAFVADVEVALLIAQEPIPHDVCRVAFHRVNDDATSWQRFEWNHDVSSTASANFGIEAATESLRIPELAEVWEELLHHPTLEEVASLHRGLEWNSSLTDDSGSKNRLRLVRNDAAAGYFKGVPPKAKFNAFEVPRMSYLNVQPKEQRRNSWQLPWDQPKAIFNKTTKSRGRWRIAAFADLEGVTCYQTFIAAWPRRGEYDSIVLAAVLNGPVANAFVATREGKVDITMETLRLIPMPVLVDRQRRELHALVNRYRNASREPLYREEADDAEELLKQIDALILNGYRMPARAERALLDFFNGETRPVSHSFTDYFAADFEPFFSLSDYLDPAFMSANAAQLLRMAKDE